MRTPSPSKSTRVETPAAFAARCPDLPFADDPVRKIPRHADFRGFSKANNLALTLAWLSQYLTRRQRKEVDIGPSVSVRPGEALAREDSRWKSFLRSIVFQRRLGVFGVDFAGPGWGHATMCLIHVGRKSRIDCFLVDPNGPHDAQYEADVSYFRRWLVASLRAIAVHEYYGASYEVRSWVLHTPIVNESLRDSMREYDRARGLKISDEPSGFCAPWSLVMVLEAVCVPRHVLTREHFARLFDRASGTRRDASMSQNLQAYARLMYLRAVLTWIAERMFDPRTNSRRWNELIARWWTGPKPLPGGKETTEYVAFFVGSNFA